MEEQTDIRTKCLLAFYEIYPLSSMLVFDTFDKKKYNITRTQQIILLSLSVCGSLTMSNLASRINTSNEQATRAVAQLVGKGLVERAHDPQNRRIVNISLTPEAEVFLTKMKAEIRGDLLNRFSVVTDEEMAELYRSLCCVDDVLKKVIR